MNIVCLPFLSRTLFKNSVHTSSLLRLLPGVADSLVSKVHIFHALPMLGLTVSNLLGRQERGDPFAAAQLLQLGKDLGSLRDAESALLNAQMKMAAAASANGGMGEEEEGEESEEPSQQQQSLAVPLAEVMSVLQKVRDTSNIEELLAAMLASVIEGTCTKLTTCSSEVTTLIDEVGQW